MQNMYIGLNSQNYNAVVTVTVWELNKRIGGKSLIQIDKLLVYSNESSSCK